MITYHRGFIIYEVHRYINIMGTAEDPHTVRREGSTYLVRVLTGTLTIKFRPVCFCSHLRANVDERSWNNS
jgi:hypothetical protein